MFLYSKQTRQDINDNEFEVVFVNLRVVSVCRAHWVRNGRGFYFRNAPSEGSLGTNGTRFWTSECCNESKFQIQNGNIDPLYNR